MNIFAYKTIFPCLRGMGSGSQAKINGNPKTNCENCIRAEKTNTVL
jgi:hypothetical protein